MKGCRLILRFVVAGAGKPTPARMRRVGEHLDKPCCDTHDCLMPRPTRPRGAVLTAAGPSMRPVLHDLALPTFSRFASRWGYQLIAVDLQLDGQRTEPAAQRAKWAKITLLRETLTSHPIVLWLDADVLLLRDDEDVAEHLRPGDFQALALEQVPHEHRVNPNTGVWLLRSCPRAFAFLDAVCRAGPQPGPWADQGAVLTALGWDHGDEQYWWSRPGRGSRFLSGTSWLPPAWNQPHISGRADVECYNGNAASYRGRPTVSDPIAVHFMGLTPAARYAHMRAALDAARLPPVREG
jgi:hypothetical protein